MIVGRGLLANTLKPIDDPQYLFYVNGISNSVVEFIPEDNAEAAEINKLAKSEPGKLFIYLSTSQVNYPGNYERPYVRHKARMEELIKLKFKNYLIVRTTNLVGINTWNENTLFNFLFNSLFAGRRITVNKEVKRNVLDADHFKTLLSYYLSNSTYPHEMIELGNPLSYTMEEIIFEFESFFNKKFAIDYVQTKKDFAVLEVNEIFTSELLKDCKINFDGYIGKLLRKYYSSSETI